MMHVHDINLWYAGILERLMDTGYSTMDRTGVGTKSLFGLYAKFDLSTGFPLLSAKKTNFKSIVTELLWFLRGNTNIKFLHENGVHIWDEWADENGNLGPVYGSQWRSWPKYREARPEYQNALDTVYEHSTIDQIAEVIHSIETNPNGRRHIVTAWNPAEIGEMALPPCHCLFQFNVQEGRLNCQLYQRSADWFLGVPFNIASYALLTMIIAQQCNLLPGTFSHAFGDYHLYANHFDQANRCLMQARQQTFSTPVAKINKRASILDYVPEDFTLLNYNPGAAIAAPVAV